MHVFSLEDTGDLRFIRKNISATEEVIRNREDMDSPDAVREYFERLLYVLKDTAALDRGEFMKKMTTQSFPLKEIGEKFRIIDEDQCTVLIPGEDNRAAMNELREHGVNRQLLRRLGIDSVNLRSPVYRSMNDAGCLEEIGANIAVLAKPDLYDPHTGLKTESDLIY